ncbi:uncharacterized protein LOC111795461 [Cucurbita pepo subsp. pepo]|uniref:uncharacterized protein LOC111795461 n=1 Tax=Cucurbita pepo subsp. pepo TaxID=3664 RepID=UPI000C9D7277|nr:uncharacterized protein LOC111795461 [Cucurbita pepo subsp. pepo]
MLIFISNCVLGQHLKYKPLHPIVEAVIYANNGESAAPLWTSSSIHRVRRLSSFSKRGDSEEFGHTQVDKIRNYFMRFRQKFDLVRVVWFLSSILRTSLQRIREGLEAKQLHRQVQVRVVWVLPFILQTSLQRIREGLEPKQLYRQVQVLIVYNFK